MFGSQASRGASCFARKLREILIATVVAAHDLRRYDHRTRHPGKPTSTNLPRALADLARMTPTPAAWRGR
jgi:hypothetical protein